MEAREQEEAGRWAGDHPQPLHLPVSHPGVLKINEAKNRSRDGDTRFSSWHMCS